MAAEGDGGVLAVDAAFDEAVDGLEEVVAVELGVEADDAGAEQAFEDLLLPGADAEGLGVRPGDVPEGDDGRLGQALADHARRQGEVVVLDQHDRVLGARLARDRVGEALVDGLVAAPVALAEDRADEGDVAERP